MMTFVKRAIQFFLSVSVIECSNISILNSSTMNAVPIAHNHTRRLLEMCFSDRLNPVVITEDLVNIVYGMPDNTEGNISVITIDDKLNWMKYEHDSNSVVYPSYPTVILSADSHKGECFEGFSLKES
ncbi:uncharacterized protein LOC103577091 [Microplitis demolitor]|uniref:uncharacterized protein LOC103577091 n=1 Tax=Microplitis demolitor TaxID=69319 RepID=UPI0006D4DD8F|nr:uncharacterized protein LOC103577091 [Microplitis demolitor]